MSESFSTICENCNATLKLKNPDLVGKKVKCPKCGEPFVVAEAPAANKKPVKKKVEDEDDFLGVDPDDYELPLDDKDLNDADDAGPVRRKRSTKGAKKKGKKSSAKDNSAKVITMVAIVLGVLAVLGGGGYGVMLLAKSASSDLDWLPTEIEGFAKIQAAQIWNSTAIQPLTTTDAAKQFADEMTKNIGTGPQDIEQMVIGFPKSGGPGFEVIVLRSRIPFDLSKFQGATGSTGSTGTAETVSHAGSQYLKRGTLAFYLADSKTLVRGPELAIQSVISRGKQNPTASKFGFASGLRDHVVIAVANPTTANPSAATGQMMGFSQNPLQDAENLLVRANSSSDIGLSIQIMYKTADSAKSIVDKTQTALSQGKTQVVQQKAQFQAIPPNPLMKMDELKKVMDGMEQVLNSITVTQSGARMSMDMSLSGQIIKDVTAMAQASPFGMMPGVGKFPSLFGN